MLKTMLVLALLAAAADSRPASLVGDYDGHQMEMAAGISLKADGRFEYGLSYGALDEEAAGTWAADDRQVVLTSDPVKAPRFTLMTQKPAASGVLRITLDLPGRIERQLFNAHVLFKDGQAANQQLGEDATLIDFKPENPPTKLALSFDVFELASDPVTIDPAKGYEFDFRFEPNDLGKVDFQGTPLKRSGEDLLLDRYGRSIRFRKVTKR